MLVAVYACPIAMCVLQSAQRGDDENSSVVVCANQGRAAADWKRLVAPQREYHLGADPGTHATCRQVRIAPVNGLKERVTSS